MKKLLLALLLLGVLPARAGDLPPAAAHLTPSVLKRATVQAWRKVLDGLGRSVGHVENVVHHSIYPYQRYQRQVSSGLYRGSAQLGKGYAQLQQQGIRSVVNLRSESDAERPIVGQAGLHYLHLPILDNGSPTREQIVEYLRFVTAPESRPAYVHCTMGKGRTGLMVALYRLAVDGWSYDAALKEAHQMGLRMPNQKETLRRFASDLASGKVPGFPLRRF